MSGRARPAPNPPRPTAQTGEEIGKIDVFETAFARTELLLPARRRTEILPRLVAAELVVGGALLRVLQRFVRFGDFLEFLLGVLFLRDVGVVFPRELAIRLLDLVGARFLVDAEGGVIVLVFHRRGSFSTRSVHRMHGDDRL